MKTLILATLVAISAFGQANAVTLYPQQFVGGGLNYNQQASPNLSGFVAYAHLVDKDHGVYSYTLVRESSIFVVGSGKTLGQRLQSLHTSTETGAALHAGKFGAFDLWALGTGGIAAATTPDGAATGFSGSAGGMATKGLGNGWYIGLAGWYSYSGVAGSTYPVGLVIGWGR
jgi:hypothetical protein